MTLRIRKVGDDLFICASYDLNGAVEWEIDEPLSAAELASELIHSLGFHPVDVYSELLNADPTKGIDFTEKLVRQAEAVLAAGEQKNEIDEHLARQLRAWLANQQRTGKKEAT